MATDPNDPRQKLFFDDVQAPSSFNAILKELCRSSILYHKKGDSVAAFALRYFQDLAQLRKDKPELKFKIEEMLEAEQRSLAIFFKGQKGMPDKIKRRADVDMPPHLAETLNDYALEVLRYRPADPVAFSGDYFKAVVAGELDAFLSRQAAAMKTGHK